METLKINTSETIKKNMEDQGRSYTWLINNLDLSRATFYSRLKNNEWKFGDIVRMKNLGIL